METRIHIGIDVVVPATHDTGSAVAAVPTSRKYRENCTHLRSGTGSLVGVEISAPILTDEAIHMTLTHEPKSQ